METLRDSRNPDAVSEALRAVRVRSSVYCRSLLGAPWGFGVEAHGHPAFHVVTAGECWLEVDGESEPIRLAAGDLAVLPTGPRHWMRDQPAGPAPELDDLLADTPPDRNGRLRTGGPGPRTELVCGGFVLEGGGAHPILGALPPVVRIRGVAGRPAPWVAATLEQVGAEAASGAPGAEIVVSRLADALLTQALRIALAELDGPRVAALRDPQVAAAVALIHRLRERDWTVGALAGEVGLSRSAFAARFRELVGESPMRYVTRARLAHAAALLHSTDATLAEIARRTGYETEFSLSKAFKRAFGIAPGAYRGQPDRRPAVRGVRPL